MSVATVVGGENDQRVVTQAQFVKAGQDFPNTAVHAFDHCDVGFAVALLPGFVLGLDDFVAIVWALPRKMRRSVRQVQEERCLSVPFDEGYRILRDEIGGVPLTLDGLIAQPYVWHADSVNVIEIVMVATKQTKEMIETLLQRLAFEIIADVPLAGESRSITCGT